MNKIFSFPPRHSRFCFPLKSWKMITFTHFSLNDHTFYDYLEKQSFSPTILFLYDSICFDEFLSSLCIYFYDANQLVQSSSINAFCKAIEMELWFQIPFPTFFWSLVSNKMGKTKKMKKNAEIICSISFFFFSENQKESGILIHH